MDHMTEAGSRLVRQAILALDALLRRLQGIHEFSQEAYCVLRIARSRSHREQVLSDGTVVHIGDPIIELHFWNEHIPPMDPEGPDLAWGLRFYRSLHSSLLDLARHVSHTPELDDVVAFHGRSSFASEMGWQRYAGALERLGFDFRPLPPSASIWERIGRFFEHLYVWALIWAFNPTSLRGKRLLAARRGELWISRTRLLERYAPAASMQPLSDKRRC